MGSDRWEEIQRLFEEALQLPRERWSSFLDDRCGDDAELRANVESLLEHHEGATGGFLKPPDHDSKATVKAARSPEPDPLVGGRVGHFRIRRLIGSGGMGKVYEALQEHPRRTVALKIMKPGIASRSALRRFEFEAQTLGRLRHPGIAQIYEAGTHEEGSGAVPYFAMEYIANAKTLTKYAELKKLGTRGRLELFARVCDAIEHGHQKGIIHRDLKPSNIVVDSSGQPKIIDFGVARATDSDMAVTTLQTDVGELQYMSPEQCEADPRDLDTRSDVYALGVVLYELVCGRLPYDLTQVAIHEAARIIREEPPTRPSTVDRTLRGDVETIALKALEKERERRYRSAADLGDDVRRYLNNEPIEARSPSFVYQVRMLAKRNRGAVGAVIAAFGGLVVGIVVTTALMFAFMNRVTEAEASAAEQRVRADRAEVKVADAGGRDWAGRPDQGDESVTLRGHEGAVRSLTFDASGRRIVSGSWDSTIRLWDIESEEEIAVLRGHESLVASVALDRDGRVIASGSADYTIKLWDALSGRLLETLRGHGSVVSSVRFSPDGTLVASGSWDTSVRLWDATTGELISLLGEHDALVTCVAFSPDGSRVASSSADKTIKIWDIVRRSIVATVTGHDDVVQTVAFSPDGSRIASGSSDKTVRLWDASTGEELETLPGHEDVIRSVAFNPQDGARLASASWDGTVRLWNVVTGEELAVFRGHEEAVFSVAFSPDGTRLASGSADGTIKLWDVPPF